ncbi:MAG: aldolase/citrate lyase family protein [Acidimicrobiales bacterium]
MADDLRPRRSVLYMPAANARALEKARDIPADALIFDLEDAVAPDAKPTAREQAAEAVRSGTYGNKELTIRCNGLDTPWGADDLAVAGAAGPSAVVIPKVSGPEALAEVAKRLEAAGAPDHTKIWAMVETPVAMFNVRAIAGFERVNLLVMGTNDLAKELWPSWCWAGRCCCRTWPTLLAAREAGVAIVDGVYNDVRRRGSRPRPLAASSWASTARRSSTPARWSRPIGCGRRRSRSTTPRRVIAAFEEAVAVARGWPPSTAATIENLSWTTPGAPSPWPTPSLRWGGRARRRRTGSGPPPWR